LSHSVPASRGTARHTCFGRSRVDMGLAQTLASLLFVQSYGAHRPLHSFPTRRSSDLALAHRVATEHGGTLSASNSQAGGAVFTLDRKSTRLNSSHLGISYAVFCLKKKTLDLHARRRPHGAAASGWHPHADLRPARRSG